MLKLIELLKLRAITVVIFPKSGDVEEFLRNARRMQKLGPQEEGPGHCPKLLMVNVEGFNGDIMGI